MRRWLVLLTVLLAVPAPVRAGDGDSARPEVPEIRQAVRVETALGPVYTSTWAPDDHYVERWADGAWWLPGAAKGTSLVRTVIRAARAARAPRTPVELRSVVHDGVRVWITPGPPFPGVHAEHGDAGYAWIAGVKVPDAAQREALAEAPALAAAAPAASPVASPAAPE